jgi:hypothetical protein
MNEQNFKKGADYFQELSGRFQREDIDCQRENESQLIVTLDRQPVALITQDGGICARPDYLNTDEANDLYFRASEIAAEVRNYMTLMDQAPPLTADGLDEPYRLLAAFNGCVLGGCPSEKGYGVQFTTWQRDHDGIGLIWGHYHGNDYAAAKEDFAIRSGLVAAPQQMEASQQADLNEGMSMA